MKLARCAHLTALPNCTLDNKKLWLGLIELLLTKDYEWRKRFDISIGFPNPNQSKNNHEF